MFCAIADISLPPREFFSASFRPCSLEREGQSFIVAHVPLPRSSAPPLPSPSQTLHNARVKFSRSIELDEALDVVAQTQRVLAHEALGAVGIACFQRRHDLLVID